MMKRILPIILLSAFLAACSAPQVSQHTEIFGIDNISLNVAATHATPPTVQLAETPHR